MLRRKIEFLPQHLLVVWLWMNMQSLSNESFKKITFSSWKYWSCKWKLQYYKPWRRKVSRMICYLNNESNAIILTIPSLPIMQVAWLWTCSSETNFGKVKANVVLSLGNNVCSSKRGYEILCGFFCHRKHRTLKIKLWFQKTSHLDQWITFCSCNMECSSQRDSNVIIHAVSQPTSTAGLHNAYKCEKKRIQKTHLLPFSWVLTFLCSIRRANLASSSKNFWIYSQ